MTIRDWILLVYCAILLAGTVTILKRNDVGAEYFAATRDLPLNWRLQAGDVRRDLVGKATTIGADPALDAFTGRYLRGGMQRDELLHIRQTDPVPAVVVPPGHVMALAPLDDSSAMPLNAGTCVVLDGADKAAVKVAALLCPAAGHPACSAILDLPSARLTAMIAGGKSLPKMTGIVPCPPS